MLQDMQEVKRGLDHESNVSQVHVAEEGTAG